MKPSDIGDYLERDWELARRLKDRYWVERKRTMTPDEALAVADGLRQLARELRPDWPDAAERERDLEIHARVSASLRRVGPAGR